MAADVSPSIVINVVFMDWAVITSRDNGASFCQVVKIRAVVMVVP